MTSEEFLAQQEARKQAMEFDPIKSQHHIFLDTLFEWERSRLPWKRWFAKSFHQQLMERCAVAEKYKWLQGGF